MDNYAYESAKAGFSIFGLVFVALAILVAATFYFLNVQDAFITLGGSFTALWISFGDGASRLDEDIFDGYGTEYELRDKRARLRLRYILSAIILIVTVLVVLFA